MTKPSPALLKSIFTILFVCSAIPAFAQRGGGHGGGGGFHGGGGGGFRGGGGMRSTGGSGPRGGSYSPPATGYAGSRGGASSAVRSGGELGSRPGNNYSRPGGNSAGGNQRFGNSVSAPPAAADGRWHSFGGSAGSHGPSGAPPETGGASSAGSFRVFNGNRGAGATGAVRSFSGQGNEVFENAPVARNVVPRSQSLSTLHNSASGTLSASSRFAGGAPLAGNRIRSGGVNAANSVQQLGSTLRSGNRFNRFGGGCWNCGFGGWHNRWGGGFGGGWGFGGPWLGFGFGFGDPFWYDPWWGPGPAYGYYGYPDSSIYAYPDSGYYAPDDNAAPPAQQDNQYDQDNSNGPSGNWATPNGPSPSLAPNSSNLAVPVLIYMKNGSIITVRDYWMIDGELHYILMGGTQHSVDLEGVDLPRTNTENAKSGVKFIFKSEPSVNSPVQPDEVPAPAPTEQRNAAPQPEAHT